MKKLFYLVSLFFISFSLASMEKEKQKKLPDKTLPTSHLNVLPAEIRALIFERYFYCLNLTCENARQVFPTLNYLSKWIPEIKIAGKRWKWKDYFYHRLSRLASWHVQPHWKLVFDAQKQKKKLSEIKKATISPDQKKIIMTVTSCRLPSAVIALNTENSKVEQIHRSSMATLCQFNQLGTLFAFATDSSIRIYNNKDNRYITSIPIKRVRGFCSFVFLNNNLYVSNCLDVEIYSPDKDLSEWNKIQTIKGTNLEEFCTLKSNGDHIYAGHKNVYRIESTENTYNQIISRYVLNFNLIRKIIISPDQRSLIINTSSPSIVEKGKQNILWSLVSNFFHTIPKKLNRITVSPVSLIEKNTFLDSNLRVITKKKRENFQIINQFFYPTYDSKVYFDFCNVNNKLHIIIRIFKIKNDIEQLSQIYISDFSEQEPLKNRIKVEDWFRQKKYQILQKLLQKKDIDQPLKEYVKHRLKKEQMSKKQPE